MWGRDMGLFLYVPFAAFGLRLLSAHVIPEAWPTSKRSLGIFYPQFRVRDLRKTPTVNSEELRSVLWAAQCCTLQLPKLPDRDTFPPPCPPLWVYHKGSGNLAER